MAVRTTSADEYRTLLSSFPSGVAVITALAGDGTPHGLTCTSLCSVTLTPPTLLVSLEVRSGTLAAVRATGRFAVNLLHGQGRHAAEVFSSRVPDRFALVPWRSTPLLRLPWLCRDAFAVAECAVADTTTVGDHTVVYGQVAGITQETDAPLLYGLRRFSCWQADPEPAVS